MTIQEIQKRVRYIEEIKGDNEAAHAEEDRLRDDFIKYVATLGNDSLSKKAAGVLKTSDIEFYRWCA